MDEFKDLTLYVVRNKEGKFFRAKGYGGYGETWADTVSKARIYSKIGQARSRVTFFTAKWPEFGVPDVVRLIVSGVEVLDETARVTKAVAAKRKVEEERDVRQKKWEFERAQKALDNAKATLARLRK